jgi:phage terminase small subunit
VSLTPKRQAFVEAYLRTWNAAEAARLAGYSGHTARSQGSRLLTFVDVQAAIMERLRALKLDADEALVRLVQQARAEHTRYLRPDGSWDVPGIIEAGLAHLVKGARWDHRGRPIIEFYDAQAALVHIGRHLGLFVDRTRTEARLTFTREDAEAAARALAEFEREMAEQDGD